MKHLAALGLAVLVALLLVLPASGQSDRTPLENWAKFRVPRVPWIGNTWMQVDGGYGIGQGTHKNQDYYALDVGLPGSSDLGLPVLAIDNGTAYRRSDPEGYGQYIKVEHAQYSPTLTSVYAHLDSYSVSDGQTVRMGAKLGALGCTGNCTGPHIHFVIWRDFNCQSESCSVEWDGSNWDKDARTGNPRLSTFTIHDMDDHRYDNFYSNNACMGCRENLTTDSAIRVRWVELGKDKWSSHRGVPCSKGSSNGCNPSKPGYDPNLYFWCDNTLKTSECRWVHNIKLQECSGLVQAIMGRRGQKGIITRSTTSGCPTSAHSVLNQMFRGYVQPSLPEPGYHVRRYLGYPTGEQFTPDGFPDYRFQYFDKGWMMVYFGPDYYNVEAWVYGGPRVLLKQWPASEFP